MEKEDKCRRFHVSVKAFPCPLRGEGCCESIESYSEWLPSYLDETFLLRFDRACLHRAGGLTDEFNECESDVNHTLWPLQSSDLNAIKHLWEILESTLRQHHQNENEGKSFGGIVLIPPETLKISAKETLKLFWCLMVAQHLAETLFFCLPFICHPSVYPREEGKMQEKKEYA